MAEAGIAEAYGRHGYAALLRRGLEEVAAEGRVGVARGGTPLARFYRLTAEQSRERYLGAGLTAEGFAAYLALHDDPDFVWIQGTMFAAWGRKPGG